MAAIDDLISQIQDVELRDRIQKEVNKLSKQKKFGLVFEEHLPECTPLFDMPIKRGCNVMLRDNKEDKSIYVVMKIEEDKAICTKRDNQEELFTFSIPDIVRVAEFGESIYPYLKPLDSVCNAPDSDLWHILIEADNYHALQLLEYLYAGKVDCIYIDPPYNTGAKDWKYNNDYVDGSDTYRHSKWLSMMEKRLKLAKKLLNPKDSVMIITIDEKEYLHLGCLLEEIFSEARMQMVSSVINPTGNNHANELSRTNEYIFILMFGTCQVGKVNETQTVPKGAEVHWEPLKRSDLASRRGTTKGGTMQFYPIYVDLTDNRIVNIGKPLSPDDDLSLVPNVEGAIPVFPIRDNGIEMNWGLTGEELKKRLDKGYVRVGKYTPNKPQKYVLSYLTTGAINDIESGKAYVDSYSKDGSVKAFYTEGKKSLPTTQWSFASHDAKNYGTGVLKCLMPNKEFPFPKSLYAVMDALNIFVGDKPNALIVDFFAGSGTTMHATMMLNHKDSGKRKCICVTNNELAENETKMLRSRGFNEGNEQWIQSGIARNITWPRVKSAISGISTTGKLISGQYKFGEEFPMADGFKANAEFFQLSFLDNTTIALGMQLKEMMPTLWMKAGGVGKCPMIDGTTIPPMLILPENKFAVLVNENAFAVLEEELIQHPEIQTVFLATDYDVNYRAMVKNLNVANAYQLYRDYLDHFRLNRGRS